MSPEAFEALDCLCRSLLLYMKRGAGETHGEGRFNSGAPHSRKERRDLSERSTGEVSAGERPGSGAVTWWIPEPQATGLLQ